MGVLPITFVFVISPSSYVFKDARALGNLPFDELFLSLRRFSDESLLLLDVSVDQSRKSDLVPVVLEVEFESFSHLLEQLFSKFNLLLKTVHSLRCELFLEPVVQEVLLYALLGIVVHRSDPQQILLQLFPLPIATKAQFLESKLTK